MECNSWMAAVACYFIRWLLRRSTGPTWRKQWEIWRPSIWPLTLPHLSTAGWVWTSFPVAEVQWQRCPASDGPDLGTVGACPPPGSHQTHAVTALSYMCILNRLLRTLDFYNNIYFILKVLVNPAVSTVHINFFLMSPCSLLVITFALHISVYRGLLWSSVAFEGKWVQI